MRPHTLDEMSTIILIFCRDGANKIELIEKCYLNDIVFKNPPSPLYYNKEPQAHGCLRLFEWRYNNCQIDD